MPDGYFETLEGGANRLIDPRLARYHDELRLVVRGPIFAGRRWAAIWRLNTGQLDHLIDEAAYRAAAKHKLDGSERLLRAGLAPVRIRPTPNAARMRLAETSRAAAIMVSLDGSAAYRLAFLAGDQERGAAVVPRAGGAGLAERRVRVPPSAVKHGWDTLEIVAFPGGGDPRFGGWKPLP
jgi:hypothetical protein